MSTQPITTPQIQQPFGKQLIAGDTWSWTITLPDWTPAGGYTLKYFFRGPGKLDILATASADNASFVAAATPTQTEGLPAGTYEWQLCVFDASNNRQELARGEVEVLPDIASQTQPNDNRSWVKKTLDAIRANLQGRASRVEQEYMVAGRQARLLTMKELLDAEGEFAARYRKEQIDSGQLKPSTNQVRVRFNG